MAYQRKAGAGRTGTLREQFNYYKRQLTKRLVEEQAFKEARGAGTTEPRIYTTFAGKSFDEVYNQGITRKRKNETIRYTGYEAVAIEINSMRRRASKSIQADMFRENYLTAMERCGYDVEAIDSVEEALNNLSNDKLSILIDSGILKSIEYVYANNEDVDKATQEILNGLEKGISSKRVKDIRAKAKQLIPNIIEKNKIMGW